MSEKLPARPTVSRVAQLLLDRNMEDKAIAGLEDCLNATVTMRNEDGKLETFPDFKTILGAIQLVLAYTIGKPVERREFVTRQVTTLEDLKQQSKSPEFRRALQELLDDAEKPVRQVPITSRKASEDRASN